MLLLRIILLCRNWQRSRPTGGYALVAIRAFYVAVGGVATKLFYARIVVSVRIVSGDISIVTFDWRR